MSDIDDPFRQLAESSPDPLLVHADMRPLYANPAFLGMAGLASFADLKTRGLETVLSRVGRAGDNGDVAAEFELKRPDGATSVAAAQVRRCTFGGEAAEALTFSPLAHVQFDLAEFRRQKEALSILANAAISGGDPLQAAVRALAIGAGYRRAAICRLSDDGRASSMRIFWDNDERAETFDYPIEGTPCQRVLETNDVYWVPDGVQEAFPVDKGLGRWNARAYIGAPIHDADGVLNGHVFALSEEPDRSTQSREMATAVARWISMELARREAVEAHRLNERTLSAIVDALPGTLQLKDREGRYTFMNRAFAELFAAPREMVLGRSPHELIDAGLLKTSHAAIAQSDAIDAEVWRTGRQKSGERITYYDNDGRPHHWLVTKRLVDQGEGRPPQLLTLSIDASDLLRAKQALRDRERQLSVLLDNLPGAAFRFRVDREGRRKHVFVSRGLEETYGWRMEDFERDPEAATRSLFTPEIMARFGRETLEAARSGRPYDAILPIRAGNGEGRWMLYRARVVEADEDGWLIDALSIDVTSQIRAEQALKEREEQLTTLIENLPGVVFRNVVRRDGERHIRFLSEGARSLYGVEPQEAVANSRPLLEKLFDPADIEEEFGRSVRCFEAGLTYEARRPLVTGWGEQKWVLLRSRASRETEDGWIVDGLAIDITEQVRAEQAVREREAQLSALLDNLPGAAWRARVGRDNQREILFISDGIEELTGWTADEINADQPRAMVRIFGPEALERLLRDSFDAYAAGRPYIGTLPVQHRDGERRWVTQRAHIVEDAGDAWIIDTVLIDVTEQVRAQQAVAERDRRLQDLRGELLQVSRASAMGALSSAIAHELNQPLAAVSNYLAAAGELSRQSAAGTPPRIVDLIDKAQKQAERAGSVISSLRRFFERGEQAMAAEDLNAAVEEAASLALIDNAAGDIGTAFELSADLPPVWMDRLQIQQVVVNLIRNAVQAMQDSECRELRIRTEADEAGGVAVEIADSGPGLPADVADRIFDRFKTTRAGGMGMGLAICKSVLDAHESMLQFRAGENGGTVFRFSLPPAGEGTTNGPDDETADSRGGR